MNRLLGPRVVMVHDLEHGNYSKVMSELGLEGHYSIHSYTDTHPNKNIHNAGLKLDIFFSDMVIVQEELVSSHTETADTVLSTFKFVSSDRLPARIKLFNKDYAVRDLDTTDLDEYFIDLNDFRRST